MEEKQRLIEELEKVALVIVRSRSLYGLKPVNEALNLIMEEKERLEKSL